MKTKLHNRILSAILVVVMLLGICPVISFADDSFRITRDGKSVTEVSVPQNEKITVTAENLPEGSYQWQIQMPGQELWVNISGQTGAELTLSYALLGSLLDQDNCASVRCAAIYGGEEVDHTAPLRATVTEPAPVETISSETVSAVMALAPAPLPAPTVKSSEKSPVGTGLPDGPTDDAESSEETTDEPATDDAGMTSHAPTEESVEETAESETEPEPETIAEPETITEPETDTEMETVPTSEASAAPENVVLSSGTKTAETLNADGDITNEDDVIYTITIEYLYGSESKFSGQRVALPYIEEVPAGHSPQNDSVDSPICVGYEANTKTISLDPPTGNVNITVYYSPAVVSYTVRHYQQNLDNDDYEWVDTTVVQAETESETDNANAAKSYTGFHALDHYHEEVAADSSTMIDIYYDREYYLMSFELDGGYGVEAIYARYGAPISVGKPTKAGWEFDGWTPALPATMPASNSSHTAKWSAEPTGVNYTIAYWLEDPNAPGTYNFWASATDTKAAGETVQADDYKDYTQYLDDYSDAALGKYEKQYSVYNDEKTTQDGKDIEIKGDGSTVVNVYYDRKQYTLKFYYALSKNDTYYVVGGSTHFFGSLASSKNNSGRNNEISLFAMYAQGSGYTDNDGKPLSNHTGQITGEPTLKTDVESRYVKDFDTTTVNGTAYNLHYLSFTAKYGADITNLWPCDVFNSVTRVNNNTHGKWSGTEAFVSAWNGEYNVWYSHNNSNQTIKGKYCELDYRILWQNGDPDDMTVSYLCFWENGADIGWSIPGLFRYNIYVPKVEGETYLSNTPRTYNGKDYYLLQQYDTIDDSGVGSQTNPAINGFTHVGTDSAAISGYDTSTYNQAYNMYFYYDRTKYNLKFVNGNTTAHEEDLAFGASISGKAPDVTYPDADQAHLYTFAGWYTSDKTVEVPASKYTLSGATMPDSNLTLYAGWEKKTFTLTINNGTTTETQEVIHGETPEAPSDPTMADAVFIGWYYMDNGVEKRFDFATMTIEGNTEVYAKWRSTKMKQVLIDYVVVEGDTRTQIAATETLMLRVGQTRTFDAKTGHLLYEEYRTGCFPTTATHSITPAADDLASDEPLRYTFEYKQYGDVPYQVEFYVKIGETTNDKGETVPLLRPAFTTTTDGKAEFVDKDTYDSWSDAEKATFASSNTTGDKNSKLTPGGQYIERHWDNDKAVVTELYIPDDLAVQTWQLDDEYLPNALRIQKIIVPSDTNPETNITANTIQFIYSYDEKYDPNNPDPDIPTPDVPDPNVPIYKSLYLIQHFVQSGSDFVVNSWSQKVGYSTATATASPISIPGYEFSQTETVARKQDGTTLDTATNELSGIITANDSLELNFYYTIKQYPYQVLYLEQGSNRVLHTAKTTDNNGNLLKANYNSKITETAIEIAGYAVDTEDCVMVNGEATKSIYVQMEADEEKANANTIVFYYKQINADLTLTKEVKLDPDQATEEGISEIPGWVYDQEFTFTVFLRDGFPKSSYSYTHTDRNNNQTKRTVTAGLQSLTVTLKHGESIRIHELPLGSYTVTETYVPGFKTTVNGYIAQEHSVILENDGDHETLAFLNSFPFYTGDLVVMKDVIKLDENDPAASEPYWVTIELDPVPSAREVDRTITFVDKNGNPITDANYNSSFTIPKLPDINVDDNQKFTIQILVPVDGEVKLKDVPIGTFIATEEVKGTVGYVYDYYLVQYNKAVHENDEVKGTSHTVSGNIHGGHPTAITFHNTYKKGDLTVTKTVTQEYEKDSWQEDTFTFSITGKTELPDGIYTVDNAQVKVESGVVTVKDTSGNDPTITVTKTADGTSWSESLTFENLPAGYYTVKEIKAQNGLEKYSVAEPAELLVNDTNNPTAFTVINTFKRTTGSLQVGKEIVKATTDATIDTTQAFTFEVELKDGTLTGPYAYTIKSGYLTATTDDDVVITSKNLPVDGKKLTFELKHDQYILIIGLPVGEYVVRELGLAGYQSSFGVVENGNYTVDPATITTNNTTKLECKNSYPVYYSDLVIKKVVENSAKNSALDTAPADDRFTFEVKISGYSANLKPASVVATYSDNTEKTLDVINDVITFELGHGEYVSLNLPVCNYVVTETKMTSTKNTTGGLEDHYDVSCTLGTESRTTSISSELLSGQKETVTFTNTYKQHFADLVIQQTGDIGKNDDDKNDSGIYTVTKKGETHPIVTVILTGEYDSVTVTQIPVGEYSVTEHSGNWTWTYKDTTLRQVTVETGESNVVTFEHTAKSIDWLHDEAHG